MIGCRVNPDEKGTERLGDLPPLHENIRCRVNPDEKGTERTIHIEVRNRVCFRLQSESR